MFSGVGERDKLHEMGEYAECFPKFVQNYWRRQDGVN